MLAKLVQAALLTLFFQLWMSLSLFPASSIADQPSVSLASLINKAAAPAQ